MKPLPVLCLYCPTQLGSYDSGGVSDIFISCLAVPEGYICIKCVEAGKHNQHVSGISVAPTESETPRSEPLAGSVAPLAAENADAPND